MCFEGELMLMLMVVVVEHCCSLFVVEERSRWPWWRRGWPDYQSQSVPDADDDPLR